MLKIKDDVKLNNLKRYGFKFDDINKYWRNDTGKGIVHYVFSNRNISTTVDKYPKNFEIHDVIYNLIQAGYVEEIGE